MMELCLQLPTNFWNSRFTEWLSAVGGFAAAGTLIYVILRGSRERFDTKFNTLLKFHKANVDEMNINGVYQGRKCFVPMFYELRLCYTIVKNVHGRPSDEIKKRYEYEKINLMDFAYGIFFYGIGPNSEKHFINFLNEGAKHLFAQVKQELEKIQKRYVTPRDKWTFEDQMLSKHEMYKHWNWEYSYLPFDGHVSRLGHYYRHLFQTSNYVISSRWLFSNEEKKYGYIKMLRAQLSNFEQLLLYYNALAWFDNEWREIFTKYRLIKNIPLPLADFHETPEEHFKKEIEELWKKRIAMFEWHE